MRSIFITLTATCLVSSATLFCMQEHEALRNVARSFYCIYGETLDEVNQMGEVFQSSSPERKDDAHILKLDEFKKAIQKFCLNESYRTSRSTIKFSNKDFYRYVNQAVFDHGDTALHQAVRHGNILLIEWLSEYGAHKSLQSKNLDNQTPLELAQKLNYCNVINLLTHLNNT